MKKIKVVYEWIGPKGPLSNNRVPNIYDLSNSANNAEIQRHLINSPFLWKSFFERFPDKFELASAAQIKNNDLFVYDYQLHYRVPFEGFFSIGAQHGLLESIQISYNVLDGIKHRNGYILLDMSLESFIYDQHFHIMHSYFAYHQIPLNKIIYQTGCPNADSIYFKYCDRNNISINDRMNIISWGAPEWQLSQMYKNDEYTSKRHIDILEKDFLSFNYRYRPHRLDLTSLFYKLGLLENSYFSISSYNPESPTNSFINSVDQSFCNRIGLSMDEVNRLQHSMLPLQIDLSVSDTDSHSKMLIGSRGELTKFYDKSLVSIVTETNAYTDIISETEKTFKPIVFKQPFILIGAPKSLENLKTKGYKTFSNWFDESYDNIVDHHQRMITIGNVCTQIKNWSRDKKKAFIEETQEIVDYNYSHFQNVYSNRIDNFWLNILTNHIN
jgi:hypothetical protein